MKSKKIVIVLMLLLFNYSFSQIKVGKITYISTVDNSEFIEKIKKDSKLEEKIKKELLDQALNAEEILFELIFNEFESLFYSTSNLEMSNDGEKKSNVTAIFSGSRTSYYYNLKTKEILKKSLNFKELLIKLNPKVWRLTQETKKIGGYTCYKAITSEKVEGRKGIRHRSIIAWYTPDIPVPFGVQNFHGLPGLTLELGIDKTTFFKAINIDLSPKEKTEIEKPKGVTLTYEEFNNKLKEMELFRN